MVLDIFFGGILFVLKMKGGETNNTPFVLWCKGAEGAKTPKYRLYP